MIIDLPIPRWLIPSALVRWVVPKFVKAIWPVLLRHSHDFEASAYAERVAADATGFYAAIGDRIEIGPEPSGPHCPLPSARRGSKKSLI